MSKKTAYLIILVVIVVLGGLLAFFYSFINSGVTPTAERQTAPKNLFPFGSGEGSASGPNAGGETASTSALSSNQTGPVPELRQISIVPTAGAIAFSMGSTTRFRYTERGTGHIYETSGDSLNQTRISNITVPKIYDALWLSDNSFILRYLGDDEALIRSYFGQIIPVKGVATSTRLAETPSTTVHGVFLPQRIEAMTIAPKHASIFYIQADESGSHGIVAAPDGSKKTEVFTSPFKEWLPQWFKDDSILLTTKASNESLGYAYVLNAKTGRYDNVLGKIRGLTALADASGGKILYSESRGSDWSLNLLTVKSGERETLLLKTFPEKCVWGSKTTTDLYCANPTFAPQNVQYPDDWYKGKVHFSDDIWKLDTTTGELTRLAVLKSLTNQDIDAVSLSLDEKDNYLVFINKNDLTLWSLKVK